MTDDPNNPGAAAVYLEREDKQDTARRWVYERIKVLSEKGRDLAIVNLPLEVKNESGSLEDHRIEVYNLEARTIHPDGTIIPVKKENIKTIVVSDSPREGKITRKVLSFPDVTVRSILEYGYWVGSTRYAFPAPEWQIQQPYTVLKAHYEFAPQVQLSDSHGKTLGRVLWWSLLPKGAAVTKGTQSSFFSLNGYALNLENVPPISEEEFEPPVASRVYQLNFYYTAFENGGDYWKDAVQRMTKAVDDFASAKGGIQDAVAGLVSPGDSEVVKAKKLYDAVQGLENTDFTRERGNKERKALGLHKLSDARYVWEQKSGSSGDLALLYLALARAAGLKAYAIEVADREERIFLPLWLNDDQLTVTLVAVEMDGKTLLVDPGAKMAPFGFVPWSHTLADGIREGNGAQPFVGSPAMDAKRNVTKRAVELAVLQDGTVRGVAQWTMSGDEALEWRQRALTMDKAELEKKFDEGLVAELPEGISAHIDHFQGLDKPDEPLIALVSVSGTLGSVTGKRMILPAHFFAARGTEPFVKVAKRTQPVDMHYAAAASDVVTYHLPEGYAPESLPADQPVAAPSTLPGQAAYRASFRKGAGTVSIGRILTRAFAGVPAADYNDLRGFYQKVAAADQQQIVLSATQSAVQK